jgi:hypothetical protein
MLSGSFITESYSDLSFYEKKLLIWHNIAYHDGTLRGGIQIYESEAYEAKQRKKWLILSWICDNA